MAGSIKISVEIRCDDLATSTSMSEGITEENLNAEFHQSFILIRRPSLVDHCNEWCGGVYTDPWDPFFLESEKVLSKGKESLR